MQRRRKASHAERHRNLRLRMRDAFSADGEADDSDEGDSDVALITTDMGRSTLRGVITLFVRLRPISLDSRVSRTTLVHLVIRDKAHSTLI